MDKTLRNHYPLLDWCRLFLALQVVCAHVGLNSGHSTVPAFIPSVASFLGLSGFLILGSLEASSSYWHFAKKRILRVYPALLFSFVLTLALFGISEVRANVMTYLTLGLGASSRNGAVWSLGVEELYYAALAIIVAIGIYRNRVTAIIAALLAMLFVSFVATRGVDPKYVSLLPGFLTGNALYLWRDRLEQFGKYWWVALALPIANLIHHESWMIGPLTVDAVIGLILLGRYSGLKAWAIPDLSYGTYLYHGIVIAFLKERVPGLFHSQEQWVFTALPSVLIVTFAVAFISWKCIEEPCLKLKNRPPVPGTVDAVAVELPPGPNVRVTGLSEAGS